jgi:hypothetical protein
MQLSTVNLDKLIDEIFLVIVAMYAIIEILVPKVAGWIESLSSVAGTDWSWIIGLILLLIFYGIIRGFLGKKG